MTEAQASLNNGFAKWERDLDGWLTRLTREDSDLVVKWEDARHFPWSVHDRANGNMLMTFADTLSEVCAWMLRYQQEHPRTTVDEDALVAARDHVLHSRKVDGLLSERGSLLPAVRVAPALAGPAADAADEGSTRPRSENTPLRLVGSGQEAPDEVPPHVRLPGADELFPSLLNPRRSRA